MGLNFAKHITLAFTVALATLLAPPMHATEGEAKSVRYEDFEELDEAEQAAIILEALASRVSEFRAGGRGYRSNIRFTLAGMTLPPSLQQRLCRKDRLLIWAEPQIGGPDEREQDDPPTQIERVDVEHYYAAHDLPFMTPEDEKRQACLDGAESLRFFKAANFEQARDASIILDTIKYRAANDDVPEEYVCENKRPKEPEFCDDFIGHLETFVPSVVEYRSDSLLRIHGTNPEAMLELEVRGTLVRSLKLIRSERIFLTTGVPD